MEDGRRRLLSEETQDLIPVFGDDAKHPESELQVYTAGPACPSRSSTKKSFSLPCSQSHTGGNNAESARIRGSGLQETPSPRKAFRSICSSCAAAQLFWLL